MTMPPAGLPLAQPDDARDPTVPDPAPAHPPACRQSLVVDRRPLLPLSVLHAALDILAEEWETDL